MLPDYPTAKEQMSQRIMQILRRRTARHRGEALNEIAYTRIHEGNESSMRRDTGAVEKTGFHEASAELQINLEEVQNWTLGDILRHLDQIAKSIGEQQARHFFEELHNVTDKTGNVVNANGEKFSPELLLQVLDKMWIEFNEDGTPQLPSMIVSPSMFDSIQASKEEFASHPEFEREWTKRFNDLIARKREEWRAREANRNLAG
jgi:hypothetical protein